MLRVARSFGANRQQTLRKIVLPATLPYIGTGVRMGVSRGLVGLFGAELFTAHSGLGYLLLDASKRYNTPLVFGILGVYLTFTDWNGLSATYNFVGFKNYAVALTEPRAVSVV